MILKNSNCIAGFIMKRDYDSTAPKPVPYCISLRMQLFFMILMKVFHAPDSTTTLTDVYLKVEMDMVTKPAKLITKI